MIKNKIAICDIYHPYIHGNTENTSQDIFGHFIVRTLVELNEFYTNPYIPKNIIKHSIHPFIRNYDDITIRYNTLNIIEPITLDGGEMIGIVKTHYIRIFQRKWRNSRRS